LKISAFEEGLIVSAVAAQGGKRLPVRRPSDALEEISSHGWCDAVRILSVRSHHPDLVSAADEGDMGSIGRGHGVVGAIPKKAKRPTGDRIEPNPGAVIWSRRPTD
jgi:hypothetical protein